MRALVSLKYVFNISIIFLFVRANVMANPKEFNPTKGLRSASSFSDLKIGKLQKSPMRTSGNSMEAVINDYLPQINKFQKKNLKFTVKTSNEDRKGRTHHRLKQTYNGIPIYGAQIILHCDGDDCSSVNGKWIDYLELSTEPAINRSDAYDSLLTALETTGEASFSLQEEPELIIIGKKLAYVLRVKTATENGKPMGHWEYYLDANTGEVLKRHTLIRGY